MISIQPRNGQVMLLTQVVSDRIYWDLNVDHLALGSALHRMPREKLRCKSEGTLSLEKTSRIV